MIFICFNFIFFYTGPKSTQSCKAPELVFTDTLISTWINSGKPHQLPVQKAHHVTSAFLCRDARNKLDIYYVCCGKRGSNLCTHGALAPRFVPLHITLLCTKLKIAQRASFLCWHKPNFTPSFSSFLSSYTSYHLKQSSMALKLPST